MVPLGNFFSNYSFRPGFLNKENFCNYFSIQDQIWHSLDRNHSKNLNQGQNYSNIFFLFDLIVSNLAQTS